MWAVRDLASPTVEFVCEAAPLVLTGGDYCAARSGKLGRASRPWLTPSSSVAQPITLYHDASGAHEWTPLVTPSMTASNWRHRYRGIDRTVRSRGLPSLRDRQGLWGLRAPGVRGGAVGRRDVLGAITHCIA